MSGEQPPNPNRKPGRPRKPIDPHLVRRLGMIQATLREIAGVVGVSESTIRRRFGAEVSYGRELGKISLRRRQWRAAKRGDTRMLIHLGKHWLAQTERHVLDVEPGIDATVKVLNLKEANLPLETRRTLLQLLRAEPSNGEGDANGDGNGEGQTDN